MKMIYLFFLLVNSIVGFPLFVISFNRHDSLQRCLDSLDKFCARCSSQERFDLTILIDGPLHHNEKTNNVAKKFKWSHGRKYIKRQRTNIGLANQRMLASSNQTYWMVVEDDVEVSPWACDHVLRGLETIMMKDDCIGISLTKPQWQLGANEKGGWRRLDLVDERCSSILYFPAVSTWAQIFKQSVWMEFVGFIQTNSASSIDGSVYEHWYQKSPKTVWSRDFQYFMHLGSYTNLHFNLADGQSLAISHRDLGLNTNRNRGPTGILAYEKFEKSMSNSTTIPKYSYCFDVQDDRTGKHSIEVNIDFGDYELLRNFECYLESKRLSVKYSRIGHDPLDYNGNKRLWTIRQLKKHGLYFLGDHFECLRFRCEYEAGLYPDLSTVH